MAEPVFGPEAEGEGTEMHQVNARHEIIREWRSLPKALRQTDEQAAAFAMQIKDKYKFSGNADPYQTIPRFIDSPKNRLPWGDFWIRHGA